MLAVIALALAAVLLLVERVEQSEDWMWHKRLQSRGRYPKTFLLWPELLSLLLLGSAFIGGPREIFVLARIVICVTSVTCGTLAYLYYGDDAPHRKRGWAWLPWAYAAIATVFNPVIPLRLTRSAWMVMDIAAGMVFILGIIRRGVVFIDWIITIVRHRKSRKNLYPCESSATTAPPDSPKGMLKVPDEKQRMQIEESLQGESIRPPIEAGFESRFIRASNGDVNANAQVELVVPTRVDIGSNRDDVQARKWSRQVAEQEHSWYNKRTGDRIVNGKCNNCGQIKALVIADRICAQCSNDLDDKWGLCDALDWVILGTPARSWGAPQPSFGAHMYRGIGYTIIKFHWANWPSRCDVRPATPEEIEADDARQKEMLELQRQDALSREKDLQLQDTLLREKELQHQDKLAREKAAAAEREREQGQTELIARRKEKLNQVGSWLLLLVACGFAYVVFSGLSTQRKLYFEIFGYPSTTGIFTRIEVLSSLRDGDSWVLTIKRTGSEQQDESLLPTSGISYTVSCTPRFWNLCDNLAADRKYYARWTSHSRSELIVSEPGIGGHVDDRKSIEFDLMNSSPIVDHERPADVLPANIGTFRLVEILASDQDGDSRVLKLRRSPGAVGEGDDPSALSPGIIYTAVCASRLFRRCPHLEAGKIYYARWASSDHSDIAIAEMERGEIAIDPGKIWKFYSESWTRTNESR
ncbi:MAG: DUF6804 family protein [Bryobacteraceae bacterium]